MSSTGRVLSPRGEELLDLAYAYVREHGLSDLSLRPLAKAVGSSPRVLLYVFGSKDDLVRVLLARARSEELELLRFARESGETHDLNTAVRTVWEWLVDLEHRPLLVLWAEAYARSLVDPEGPWSNFAQVTVEDWIEVLSASQPEEERRTVRATA